MTPQYIQRLIELAKEVQQMNQPEYIEVKSHTGSMFTLTQRGIAFNNKLNHLLGYILALEDWEHDSLTKDEKCVIKGGYSNVSTKPAEPIATRGRWGTPHK